MKDALDSSYLKSVILHLYSMSVVYQIHTGTIIVCVLLLR